MKSITVHGYKLNNYDATYEPRDFIFEEESKDNSRVIKVKDFQSGEEFWFSVPTDEYYKYLVETPRRQPKRNYVHDARE